MSTASSVSGYEDQKELELREASLNLWKCIFAFVVIFSFLGGISLYYTPLIFLLIWAASTKHCEIAVAISEIHKSKRKRMADDAGASDEDSETNIHIPRSVLLEKLSTAQTALSQAQSDLKNWDSQILHQEESDSSTDSEDAEKDDTTSETETTSEDDTTSEEDTTSDYYGTYGDGTSEKVDEDENEDGDGNGEGDGGGCDLEYEYKEGDELWMFEQVLANIRLEKLPELASKLRYQLELKNFKLDSTTPTPELIECIVHNKPLAGSFNILWVIEFIDGLKWLLKVCSMATVVEFDEFRVKRMEAEVNTMRLIKSKTTIPVPTIYTYDTTFNNIINSPYIMMEMFEGVEWNESWYNESCSKAELEEHRERTLKDCAQMMNQLGQLRFDTGGWVTLDEHGNPSICPMEVVDSDASLGYDHEGYMKSYDKGPFSDPAEFMTCKLDLHSREDYGDAKLIKTLISLLPHGPDPKFVLAHPDYDTQNILVAADGSVSGIIDWDGVSVVPRIIGNEAYPLWLTSDWDPSNIIHEAKYVGLTQKQCIHYRRLYTDFLKESKPKVENTSPGTLDISKTSLLAGALHTIARHLGTGRWIGETLHKIMRELAVAGADDPRAPQEAQEMEVPLLGYLNGTEENPGSVAFALTEAIGSRIVDGTISDDEMGWLRDAVTKYCTL